MKKNLKEMLTTAQNVGNMDTATYQALLLEGRRTMNVVFEIAEIEHKVSKQAVSIVYSGSDSTIAVSGLGEAVLEAAKAQGRSVVPMIDSVRINSTMIIKPAAGKVYCLAGQIVEGTRLPEPWEVVDTVPIIVEIDKEAAKQQNLFKMLKLAETAEALCEATNEEEPGKYSLFLLDKLRVSTFKQDQWNELRNTTAYLIKL